MHMSFYFSYTFKDFLLKGVDINSKWGMVQLCLGIAALSVLLELLKSGLVIGTETYKNITNEKIEQQERSSLPILLQIGIIKRIYDSCFFKMRKKLKNKIIYHVLGSVLYTFIVILNFIIMLSVMTFNGYIMIAAVVGYGLGYFIFGFLRMPYTIMAFQKASNVKNKGYGVLTNAARDDDTLVQSDQTINGCTNNLENKAYNETVPLSISPDNPNSSELSSAQIAVVEVEIHPR